MLLLVFTLQNFIHFQEKLFEVFRSQIMPQITEGITDRAEEPLYHVLRREQNLAICVSRITTSASQPEYKTRNRRLGFGSCQYHHLHNFQACYIDPFFQIFGTMRQLKILFFFGFFQSLQRVSGNFSKSPKGFWKFFSLQFFLHMTKSMCIAVQLRKFFFHNSQLHNERLLEKSQNP